MEIRDINEIRSAIKYMDYKPVMLAKFYDIKSLLFKEILENEDYYKVASILPNPGNDNKIVKCVNILDKKYMAGREVVDCTKTPGAIPAEAAEILKSIRTTEDPASVKLSFGKEMKAEVYMNIPRGNSLTISDMTITPETELLDVGTGSGILAILSLMYGAKHAVGTDLDPCAVDAVADNMANNGIAPEQFEMMIGNIINDKAVQDQVGYEKYDIVVANILADVLVPLTPVIVNQLKEGGIYITSGIIDDKEMVVTEAVKAAGLELLEVTYQGEWVSVTARKKETQCAG